MTPRCSSCWDLDSLYLHNDLASCTMTGGWAGEGEGEGEGEEAPR